MVADSPYPALPSGFKETVSRTVGRQTLAVPVPDERRMDALFQHLVLITSPPSGSGSRSRSFSSAVPAFTARRPLTAHWQWAS